MSSTLSHRFDQAAWRTILEFWGIYGVDLDYSVIYKLHASDIVDALRWSGAVSPFAFDLGRRSYYYNQDPIMWKKLLLKKIANGFKNINVYEELQMKIENYNKCIDDEKTNVIRYLREIGSVDGWR